MVFVLGILAIALVMAAAFIASKFSKPIKETPTPDTRRWIEHAR